MLHNQTHKIVHSSAIYYQNLIIIHECSKKLLKMKNSKSFFLTPSMSPGEDFDKIAPSIDIKKKPVSH